MIYLIMDFPIMYTNWMYIVYFCQQKDIYG